MGVEVTFEDASVQVYANRTMLRHPRETLLAPKGKSQHTLDLSRTTLYIPFCPLLSPHPPLHTPH